MEEQFPPDGAGPPTKRALETSLVSGDHQEAGIWHLIPRGKGVTAVGVELFPEGESVLSYKEPMEKRHQRGWGGVKGWEPRVRNSSWETEVG